MNQANKILLRIEGALALTISIIAIASYFFETISKGGINLKFGAINAIVCGMIMIFVSILFIKDNKEKVLGILKVAAFIVYVGILILITTLIVIQKWFYLISITILITLIVVQMVFFICMKREKKEEKK